MNKKYKKDISNLISGGVNPIGFNISFNSLLENLTPEESKKASEIFKTIIDTQLDKLASKYGKDAEKVAYGIAISKAKQQPKEEPEGKEGEETVKEINSKQDVGCKYNITSITEKIFNELRNNDQRRIKK